MSSNINYIGMNINDVKKNFVNDYGNEMHLDICNEERFYQDFYCFNNIRVLLENDIVINQRQG